MARCVSPPRRCSSAKFAFDSIKTSAAAAALSRSRPSRQSTALFSFELSKCQESRERERRLTVLRPIDFARLLREGSIRAGACPSQFITGADGRYRARNTRPRSNIDCSAHSFGPLVSRRPLTPADVRNLFLSGETLRTAVFMTIRNPETRGVCSTRNTRSEIRNPVAAPFVTTAKASTADGIHVRIETLQTALSNSTFECFGAPDGAAAFTTVTHWGKNWITCG